MDHVRTRLIGVSAGWLVLVACGGRPATVPVDAAATASLRHDVGEVFELVEEAELEAVTEHLAADVALDGFDTRGAIAHLRGMDAVKAHLEDLVHEMHQEHLHAETELRTTVCTVDGDRGRCALHLVQTWTKPGQPTITRPLEATLEARREHGRWLWTRWQVTPAG